MTTLLGRLTDLREMIFNIPKTIAFLSAGTTLEAGSLIMVHNPFISNVNIRLELDLVSVFSESLKSFYDMEMI
jgi:hypothetical protein